MQTLAISGAWVAVSTSLICFNKYLMQPGRFPHALFLTTVHLAVSTAMSLLLYTAAPSLFPSMQRANEDYKTVLKYIAPLGMLLALALYCSNSAYLYSSVAFLQFCKEGNIAIVFAMSCALGLQVFSWTKLAILSVVIAGCSICATGESNFVLMGFLLQITSQLSECSKNIISEIVMTGAGLKLDVLTFVMFQAPCCLVYLLAAAVVKYTPEVGQLSTMSCVIIGVVKDIVLVLCSFLVFGSPISQVQFAGFSVIIAGIALWSRLKLQEQSAASEKVPLLLDAKLASVNNNSDKAETATPKDATTSEAWRNQYLWPSQRTQPEEAPESVA
ncbi:unnamed protein product [Polarella glacialis]|uniref:Sugar phosphate transporter domain-containing protein n=1 Tax=Polarella glacialis TaxID=89957 RepID=A0A813IKL4_POLGL|nr:unnamed protein product [Polarella glacialis]CAE8719229.1 unnamed protein product [Polarella glacialis]